MTINKLLAHNSNFTKGRKQDIKFLVIHYTANNGDTAKGNCNYFKTGNRNASAHYFVDEKEVWQSVEDNNTAWHCGTKGKYYHKYCRNENAIGIELCSEKDSKGNFYFNDKTVNTAIELVKILMKKYNIPVENVIRHYDVTHKVCPAPFVNNVKAWDNFKAKLKGDDAYMKVKRIVEVNGVRKELEAINDNGKNYYSIAEVAEMLGKKAVYDNVTKVTKIM
ncbi:MAG: N-acetylmuramoyl-L-alanine amidase [Eubacteriales bacterium]|nr:N-acetylmuramoyl-L-alanine amidase [Eubacteriales bacterium]